MSNIPPDYRPTELEVSSLAAANKLMDQLERQRPEISADDIQKVLSATLALLEYVAELRVLNSKLTRIAQEAISTLDRARTVLREASS